MKLEVCVSDSYLVQEVLSMMLTCTEPEGDGASLSGVEVKNTQSVEPLLFLHYVMILLKRTKAL